MDSNASAFFYFLFFICLSYFFISTNYPPAHCLCCSVCVILFLDRRALIKVVRTDGAIPFAWDITFVIFVCFCILALF